MTTFPIATQIASHSLVALERLWNLRNLFAFHALPLIRDGHYVCTERWGIRTPKWQVVQKMCNEIDTNGNARIGQYTLSQALSALFLDVLLFEMEV